MSTAPLNRPTLTGVPTNDVEGEIYLPGEWGVAESSVPNAAAARSTATHWPRFKCPLCTGALHVLPGQPMRILGYANGRMVADVLPPDLLAITMRRLSCDVHHAEGGVNARL